MKKLLVLILLFLGTSCAQKKEFPSITFDEFLKKYKSDSSLVLLDVRTPAELVGPLGKLEGVINISIQELNARLDELNPYKDKEIAVICRSGNRSVFGTKILIENGFNAVNVEGGMKAYRKKVGDQK